MIERRLPRSKIWALGYRKHVDIAGTDVGNSTGSLPAGEKRAGQVAVSLAGAAPDTLSRQVNIQHRVVVDVELEDGTHFVRIGS